MSNENKKKLFGLNLFIFVFILIPIYFSSAIHGILERIPIVSVIFLVGERNLKRVFMGYFLILKGVRFLIIVIVWTRWSWYAGRFLGIQNRRLFVRKSVFAFTEPRHLLPGSGLLLSCFFTFFSTFKIVPPCKDLLFLNYTHKLNYLFGNQDQLYL